MTDDSRDPGDQARPSQPAGGGRRGGFSTRWSPAPGRPHARVVGGPRRRRLGEPRGQQGRRGGRRAHDPDRGRAARPEEPRRGRRHPAVRERRDLARPALGGMTMTERPEVSNLARPPRPGSRSPTPTPTAPRASPARWASAASDGPCPRAHRGGHLRRGADPPRQGRARGRRTTGAVGVRRPAGAESRVPRRAQVGPGLESRPRPVSTLAEPGLLARAAVRRRARAVGIDPLEDRLADVAQLLHLRRSSASITLCRTVSTCPGAVSTTLFQPSAR